MGTRSRMFCFTDYFRKRKLYDDIECEYLIVGEEICPKTKKVHWQGFIYFANARSFESVKKLLDKIHVEICKGTAKANIDYCSKDDNIVIEKGTRPNQGKRSDIQKVAESVLSGKSMKEIAQEHPVQFIKHYRGIEKLVDTINPQVPRNSKPKVIILWGEPGSGKTRKAVENGGSIIEYVNGFFLNYDNQETVIFDDFNPKEWDRSLFLKLIDRYPLKINVKNGQKEWNPKTIYITSNFDPNNWFSVPRNKKENEVTRKAIMRRVDSIEFME